MFFHSIKFGTFIVAFAVGICATMIADYLLTPVLEPPVIPYSKVASGPKYAESVWGSPLKECSKTQTCGSGSSGPGKLPSENEFEPRLKAKVTSPLRILSKKKAAYTEMARSNGVQGNVTLRVTFLATGSIGSITVIKSLPNGLTESAIEAARLIKFEPEKVNGKSRTTSRPVSFTFNIY